MEQPLYKSAPYPVGAAVGYRSLINDTIMNVVSHEFNSMTAENSMKMYTILRDTNYNFTQPDAYISYAETNDMRMFGHTLLWHYGLPDHIKKLEGDTAALRAFIAEYINTVVSRYKGKIDAWDVVNEVVLDNTGNYRENIWYKTLGEDYIEMAFRNAHEADPEAKLFINDYNLESDSVKLQSLLNLCLKLKNKGVPIHGIGIQMHIKMETPDQVIARHLRKAAESGLLIHISELDITFNRGTDGEKYSELTPEMKELQAEKFKNIAEIYNKEVPDGQQYGITLWGISDKFTWIRGHYNIMDWPLIFNDSLQKKPAYYGFKAGLSSHK